MNIARRAANAAATLAALAMTLGATTVAAADDCKSRGELDSNYCDENGDLVAEQREPPTGGDQREVPALVAKLGKAHRLAEVVAVAKKVGLSDADVKDKDADGVRAAAVARKYPGAAKHLDQKPVLDSMWLAIVDAAGKVHAAPAPAATPEPRDRPAPRTDAAGDVSPAAAAAPKVALVTHNYG